MTKSDRSYGYRRPPKLQRRDLMFISLFLGPAPERLKFNPWRGAEALLLVCIVQELLTIVPLGFRYSMFSFSRHNLKERRTSSSKPACLVSPSSLLMQAALARPFARDRQALSFPSRSQRPSRKQFLPFSMIQPGNAEPATKGPLSLRSDSGWNGC